MKLFTKLDCVRRHDFIVYSFQGSRDTGKIAGKRSSRALTSRILRPRDCCMAENVPCQQTKKAWSTAPPLPRASLQISFSPAPLRLCIPLHVWPNAIVSCSCSFSLGQKKKYPTGWLRASRRRRAVECRLAPDFMCEGIGATTWHVLEGWHRQKTRALLAVVWTLLPHTLASGPIRCARRSVSAQFLLSGSEDPLPPFPAGILRSDLWPVAACVYFMPAPAD